MQWVIDTIRRIGWLWPRDKIVAKLIEELGELVQAFRKKTRKDQEEELGDLLFACLALAERENFDVQNCLNIAVAKYVATAANPPYVTGKVSDPSSRTVHTSYQEAVDWIDMQCDKDPKGVHRGDYYIDGPDGDIPCPPRDCR